MGNKSSHDESDGIEESRDKSHRIFKTRNSSRSSVKLGDKQEEDVERRDSNTSSVSDKDFSETGSDGNLSHREQSGHYKPDGITKLAKELFVRSQEVNHCDGISLDVFTTYVCKDHTSLGRCLYNDFLRNHKSSKKISPNKKSLLSKDAFVAGSQKIVQLIGDKTILSYYIQVFADGKEMMCTEDIFNFIEVCYLLSSGTRKRTDFNDDVAQTVVEGMFHKKNSLSMKYVNHWFEENCPNIVVWMHRSLVHQLTVGFRALQNTKSGKEVPEHVTDGLLQSTEVPILQFGDASISPLKIDSPLRRNMSFQNQSILNEGKSEQLELPLHPMQVWILGAALPTTYTRPHLPLKSSSSANGFLLMDPHTFITKMIASSGPTHWTCLFNSDQHGLSLNRFEHHVMGYRGPTVTFLHAEDSRLYCVAIDQPWKESIQFWGSTNSIALQLNPEFHVLDRGEKLMYFNTSVRGYPFGLQIGTDHRNPYLEIDKEFSRLSYRKIPYRLEAIEVWGCGSIELRDSQLEHKKWELKQVEKSRQVKLSALDWNDHPDKCLLDMAGNRPNYSQFGNS